MSRSNLQETLAQLSKRAASAIVARGRIASPALNAALLRRLSSTAGRHDSFLADPVFETASLWQTAKESLDDLAGPLLHPDLVSALESAQSESLPRALNPYQHQLEAWRAAGEGHSCLVSSGTGSGKTECFMIPILDDLLRLSSRRRRPGVRAILIYPLNALIESQRQRLAAWAEGLNGRVRFALYNGLTPETPRGVRHETLSRCEVGDRRTIRREPPEILVTNITMLEYLLLRASDQSILEMSQGLLRWIVLDEAHSYIGSQAAEMALLLRRVRAAFGVTSEQVRLMATSATISEGADTGAKLQSFVADLAGVDRDATRVIEGQRKEPQLPPAGPDTKLQPEVLRDLSPEGRWQQMAPHPRIQDLHKRMSRGGVTLTQATHVLFGTDAPERRRRTQTLIDLAAQAVCPDTQTALLAWRAHLFVRAQDGLWACVDPACSERDEEIAAEGSGWRFGAVWLAQRDRCACGAPVFELVSCGECGTPHLRAGLEIAGAVVRLTPLQNEDWDQFAVDAEPDGEDEAPQVVHGQVLLAPAKGGSDDSFVDPSDGQLFENLPPEGKGTIALHVIEDDAERRCCPGADREILQSHRYGPAFLMGATLPDLVEALASPLGGPGLPMSGKRALTFSDSRQGTARLAAKLQQEAERTMTRAFLYHSVQAQQGLDAEEREKLEKELKLFRKEPEDYAEQIAERERKLGKTAAPIAWDALVDRFAQHPELQAFAVEVWRPRLQGGQEMAEDPRRLAQMFLYRELFRRPRVQNNAETMGLLRLCFPTLEENAAARIPEPLRQQGVGEADWIGLVLAAIDFVFRERLATHIPADWMEPLVNPRGRRPQAICQSDLPVADRPPYSLPWPAPVPINDRPSRFIRLLYAVLGGHWSNPVQADLAAEVLTTMWGLITRHATTDVGRGAYRLDFGKAAVLRLDQAWLCPVTRRIIGYTPGGRSPYDPDEPTRRLVAQRLPSMPKASAGGLTPAASAEVLEWCHNDDMIATLREEGLWTSLHDRVATYAPFLRTQEHSAQIERPVLALYEEAFRNGKINVLNCSTTMELGVDIPNVQLVINANVPPSVSNYRQRAGRAGRRREPWAFAATFCRDLPLDRVVFDHPLRFLNAAIVAPAVRLSSPMLVARHVNAALLAAFLRGQPDRISIRASSGDFFGATEEADDPIAHDSLADRFLEAVRGEWASRPEIEAALAQLTRGTVMENRAAAHLAAETAERFETQLRRWRAEHGELLRRAAAAEDRDLQSAFGFRAKRMRGEFLLGELARRGFTPAYGFPVDVVAFDHLAGHRRQEGEPAIAFGEFRGSASRTLDVAIREYAPGAEIVLDGLVHRSEGISLSVVGAKDASGVEDLQTLWDCGSCQAFGLDRLAPEACPACGSYLLQHTRSLRPSGFRGRRQPHTGYERLSRVPYEMPRVSAAGGAWQALPAPEIGRIRAGADGEVINLCSGPQGEGYAVCLSCGRAEAETEAHDGAPIPQAIREHSPLAAIPPSMLVGGYCTGGLRNPQRIQRNVRLTHAARTDVFELELPAQATEESALSLAAGLREALAERLGSEAREIGLAVGRSGGPAARRVSIALYDRAAGGAGLSTRLAELDWFQAVLKRASERLDCPEECTQGCPACILRPDLNFGERLDRVGGHQLSKDMLDRLYLPDRFCVFGPHPHTRALGLPLAGWIDRQRLSGRLQSLTLYLHGSPSAPGWEPATWPLARVLPLLASSGTRVRMVLSEAALSDPALDLAFRLDLLRLEAHGQLAVADDLPVAGDASVLAVATVGEDRQAVAAPEESDALPGPGWGMGEAAPLVWGQADHYSEGEVLDTEKLVASSLGNAWAIAAGSHLDGAIDGFGKRFWALLDSEAQTCVSVLKGASVERVEYSDRYLLTPLTFRLLYEVVKHVPGGSKLRSLSVTSAFMEHRPRSNQAAFSNFPDDRLRRNTLEALMPNARIEFKPKRDLAHERRLALQLSDGQIVSILLDQGFGAWRAVSNTHYDFGLPAKRQAHEIRRLACRVAAEQGRSAMIVVGHETMASPTNHPDSGAG